MFVVLSVRGLPQVFAGAFPFGSGSQSPPIGVRTAVCATTSVPQSSGYDMDCQEYDSAAPAVMGSEGYTLKSKIRPMQFRHAFRFNITAHA